MKWEQTAEPRKRRPLREGVERNRFACATGMKAVLGRKTDQRDAEWIADLLQYGLLKSSYIPNKAQRELRELVTYRRSQVGEKSRKLNRLHPVPPGARHWGKGSAEGETPLAGALGILRLHGPQTWPPTARRGELGGGPTK